MILLFSLVQCYLDFEVGQSHPKVMVVETVARSPLKEALATKIFDQAFAIMSINL